MNFASPHLATNSETLARWVAMTDTMDRTDGQIPFKLFKGLFHLTELKIKLP